MGTFYVNHRLTILSFFSLWIMVHTNHGRRHLQGSNSDHDYRETNKTDPACQQDFSGELDTCIEGFLMLHHQLGLMSNNRSNKISVIYISIHRDMYCKSYITSLQCIHDSLASCSTDTSTSLVQYRLSQLWALTANQICHINDQHSLPDQITELLTNNTAGILGELIQDEAGHEGKSENIDRDHDKVKSPGDLAIDANNEYFDQNNNRKNGAESTSMANKDASFRQYEPLLKLLQQLLTPEIAQMEDPSFNLHTPSQFDIGKPMAKGRSGFSTERMKVKFETVFLRKLKITNTVAVDENPRSEGAKQSQASSQTTRNSQRHNGVVKEFEISTEDRKSEDRKTSSTIYKWKTKLKHIM